MRKNGQWNGVYGLRVYGLIRGSSGRGYVYLENIVLNLGQHSRKWFLREFTARYGRTASGMEYTASKTVNTVLFGT